MSDTLQEREDQIANEEADERTFQRIRRARLIGNPGADDEWCDDCHGYTHMPYCPLYVSKAVNEQGGSERVKVELINGVEGQCVGVNDYRICGPKPWGGGSVVLSWTTDKNDVLRAFLTPDQKHAWLADDLEVVSANQHQVLVATLRQSVDLLRYLKDTAFALHVNDRHKPEAFSGCEHTICQRACQAWNEVVAATGSALNEQRSTSE